MTTLQQTIEQEKARFSVFMLGNFTDGMQVPRTPKEQDMALDTFAKNIVRAVINEIEGMSIWTANNTPKDPQAIKDDLLSKLQGVLNVDNPK